MRKDSRIDCLDSLGTQQPAATWSQGRRKNGFHQNGKASNRLLVNAQALVPRLQDLERMESASRNVFPVSLTFSHAS